MENKFKEWKLSQNLATHVAMNTMVAVLAVCLVLPWRRLVSINYRKAPVYQPQGQDEQVAEEAFFGEIIIIISGNKPSSAR
jgi:hypothetical protein